MAVAAVALTVVNVAQLGLDPVTDAAEAADVGALATDVAATTAEETAGEGAATAGEGAGSATEEGSKAAAEVARSCVRGGQSFTPGTKVLLTSGAAIPISQLKPGEKVLATNTRTGKTQGEAVAAVLVHRDTDLYDLKIRAGNKTAVINTTSDHLFWVPGGSGGGAWVKAGALRYGTHFRAPSGSDSATMLAGWIPRQSAGWMWDLTVPGDDDHDFYIDTGAGSVLVHNTGGMEGCSDAAYQGVLHITEEAAKEGPGGAHDLGMSEDALASYLDEYANSGTGQLLKGGASGWYDAERGVMIIQRSEYSMTAYKATYEEFLSKLASNG